ncbi:PREDICTED: uncharacterized protein LOC104595346 isoform X2 [Nelumbo nucifera]|uniref:Lipoyl-binding domain-containing protein n=2 Tax=Nelumbo nucifera TaxID=4432 RepID=A0A822XZM3_NELNU|nr:PREDICTED: uncharacterized protein LOC104595346 isoform X2 [Nelumbo nucifera]DAD27104.1 TPA_asm: hypothetical protein HUJ06_028572 [Nelumbo nucifera]
MAACNLGCVSNARLSSFYMDFGRTRSASMQTSYAIRSWGRQKQPQYAGFISTKQKKPLSVSCSSSSEVETAADLDSLQEKKSNGITRQIIPNSTEVQALLTEICDTTYIAEFELKLAGFRLYVTRDVAGKSAPPPPPSSLPANVSTTSDAPALNGSVSTPSLAIAKAVPSSGEIQRMLNKDTDESLVILQSPKVGYFRRSRTIKGKRAPPSCQEKQVVKEGQVLCFIEQLGGQIPIESDVSGEVIKILRDDGEPVGYGDALIAILPSFPGIKKLQ